jgi:predicted KAP-like P-loop ATPase
VSDRYGRSDRDLAGETDLLFLSSADKADHKRLRRALMRLFPRLEYVWSNLSYDTGSANSWTRDRLVCSREHFDSYFRFSVGDDVMPREEIEALVVQASNGEYVKQKLREALSFTRRDGKTKAMLLLDELNLHAETVADTDVEPLLVAIFELADELNVESDKAGAFDIGDNHLRVHWLLRRLTLDRFDLTTRSKVLMFAAEKSPLNWLIDFAQSAYRDYFPTEGKPPELEQKCLTTKEDALALRQLALSRIREASKSDILKKANSLGYLLFMWRDMASDDGVEVKAWTSKQMENDEMIAIFAKAFTSYSWSQSMGFAGLGDTVAQRHVRANIGHLDKIIDVPTLRARVEQLAFKGEAGDPIGEFLSAWKRYDRDPHG